MDDRIIAVAVSFNLKNTYAIYWGLTKKAEPINDPAFVQSLVSILAAIQRLPSLYDSLGMFLALPLFLAYCVRSSDAIGVPVVQTDPANIGGN